MSEELNNLPESDMELKEGFFEREEMELENEFKDQFDDPIPLGTGLIDDPEPDPDVDPDVDPEELKLEDFNFDDSIKQEEEKELAELNAKFGSDFKSMNEFKSAIKETEQAEVNTEIQKDAEWIAYSETALNTYDDKKLVLEDLQMKALRSGKDLKNPEVEDEIKSKIEHLEETGFLSYAADNVKEILKLDLKERKSRIQEFEKQKTKTVEQQMSERKTKVQDSIAEIFKAGTFMGIKPTKEDLIGVYKDVIKNKHISHLENNPEDAIKFALFKKYYPQIEEVLKQPSFNDGVKSTLERTGLKGTSQTVKTPKQTGSDPDKLSYLESFIK